METLGLITLAEADSLLEFNIQYDFWNDTNVYTSTTGTWQSAGLDDNLVGTGTLATTELSVNQNILIQYNTAKISVITDNTHITLDAEIQLTDHPSLYKITAQQRTDLEALWLFKKKCLLTAYTYITTYCNLPDVITDELKQAQAFLAAILYRTNGQSTVLKTEATVKSYSIGDMSYSFETSSTFAGNTPLAIFPPHIYDLLKPYLKANTAFAKVTSSAR